MRTELDRLLEEVKAKLETLRGDGLARCPWCLQPSFYVGESPAAHPACYARMIEVEKMKRDLITEQALTVLMMKRWKKR